MSERIPLPCLVHLEYEGDNLVATSMLPVTWDQVRMYRENELSRTDYWALKDMTMSQAKKDYRSFLRDLPQNFASAYDAAEAWHNYEVPA